MIYNYSTLYIYDISIIPPSPCQLARMPPRSILLFSPAPLLLVSGSWLLLSLLLTPYILDETNGSFVGLKNVWERELENQAPQKECTNDLDKNRRLLQYVMFRRYGTKIGVPKSQEENKGSTSIPKTLFQNWYRLTKRGSHVWTPKE